MLREARGDAEHPVGWGREGVERGGRRATARKPACNVGDRVGEGREEMGTGKARVSNKMLLCRENDTSLGWQGRESSKGEKWGRNFRGKRRLGEAAGTFVNLWSCSSPVDTSLTNLSLPSALASACRSFAPSGHASTPMPSPPPPALSIVMTCLFLAAGPSSVPPRWTPAGMESRSLLLLVTPQVVNNID